MGFFDKLAASLEKNNAQAEEEKRAAEKSLLIHLFGSNIVEIFSQKRFYDDVSRSDFGGIDFGVVRDGFTVRMFTTSWKILSDNTYKFADIKNRNRAEWGADAIDREPDFVASTAAQKAMLSVLLQEYVSKIPYLKVDLKIARATFNGRPY